MTEPHKLDQETVDLALKIANDMIPDDAEVAMLSFTGGRAFGWGHDKHDVDLHGYMVKPGWFKKVHTDKHNYDLTLFNIEYYDRKEGQWPTHRFKQFYDKSNPVYVNADFDYDEFMDQLEPSLVENVYPHSIETQIARLETRFRDRTALHSYKELLIPLHYLRTGEIEANVVDGIDTDLPGMDQCVRSYKHNEDIDIDEQLVYDEIDELFDELGREVDKNT